MNLRINKIFGRSAPPNDFSTFFHDASARDKKQLISGAVRKANEDQKNLVEQYRNHEERLATEAN